MKRAQKRSRVHLVVVEIATTTSLTEAEVIALVERALGRVDVFANVDVEPAEDGDKSL